MIAQEDILQKLRLGASAWNDWRKTIDNKHISLDGLEVIGLNLDGIDLSKLSIRDALFKKCSFRNADLISANFSSSQLQSSDFSGAKMIATVLEKADLTRAKLHDANLLMASTRGAIFDRIDFRGHDLSGFHLKGASLAFCNLENQNLSRQDLSQSNLRGANLKNTNLTNTIFTGANLSSAVVYGAKIQKTNFKGATLTEIDLSNQLLTSCNFEGANLAKSDLREADLSEVNLSSADVSGAKLWKLKNKQWNITDIQCRHAFWDKEGEEKTKYRKHEFERIYSESITIELHYPYRLGAFEIATLPIFIEHLQAVHWGIILRLKSVSDVAGGALLSLVVEEAGSHSPAELKNNLQEEAERIQTAQLSLKSTPKLQLELKEKLASIKEEFWPRLLELAADHEQQQVRNLTVVLMDLKDFSTWGNDELSEKLSLFRGLVKPVLTRWHANYPNMEGDSLRITFKNASMGLACACMVRDVLTAAGFEVRIGVEVGEVSVIHNEVTDVTDLEGLAVSMAARLEAIAKPGQILVTHKVRQFTEHRDLFLFEAMRVKLSKNIGNMKKGDNIDCFSANSKSPLQNISS